MCGIFVYSGRKKALPDLETHIEKLRHRGPDKLQVDEHEGGLMAFHRLRIMDLGPAGDQPFVDEQTGNKVVCNGEIYNQTELRRLTNYPYISDSDCEVLLPLYAKYGLKKTAQMLDAEFAMVLWDARRQKHVAARDPIGIRPLFYGYSRSEGEIIFASEAKAVSPFCDHVEPFPPGHVYDGEEFVRYLDISRVCQYHTHTKEEVLSNIHDKLVAATRKRLCADAPVGLLLSGGLDSSLVCAIAQRYSSRPIKTFAVGMHTDGIDLKYARDVARFIGSDHTEVLITEEDVLSSLREVIWSLESYDITTIRASIGMYLVCKHISENSDVRVLLTGEVSDELFGYKYTDFAPNPVEFQRECRKRIRELYMYDVLRADRCISAHALEARVPFSDSDFVQYVMGIHPRHKMNNNGVGKYLLRAAFEGGGYLPEHILWREKAAFSDAVGHSLADTLQAVAEESYSEQDPETIAEQYPYATPISKESLMYRDLFEQMYPRMAHLIASLWMPNPRWENCQVADPSARALPNYGASGV
ncbi:MAG: asparagine synthase B [candidate division Zixibacteria bacterium]|nr:asparagine synthase B [candidate division Zixibacteria bacterium]MDH3936120.1 asparagine synthase B [candidate division Zixibacteria bacterium]MDH4032635.1 asparagine synthase B [candidate division Zixibacteria bacterium]